MDVEYDTQGLSKALRSKKEIRYGGKIPLEFIFREANSLKLEEEEELIWSLEQ